LPAAVLDFEGDFLGHFRVAGWFGGWFGGVKQANYLWQRYIRDYGGNTKTPQ